MSEGPILLSHGGWIRKLTAEEQDFADWAQQRGMRALFEFYPETLTVSLTMQETVGETIVGRAIDVGDLPLGPEQVTVREYLETRLRREHQAVKDAL